MNTAEQLGISVKLDNRGVHLLLWSDKDDLVRALIVLLAVWQEYELLYLLLATEVDSRAELRKLIERRSQLSLDHQRMINSNPSPDNSYWLIFIQQATSKIVGPWLNGWRRPLSDSPGSILFVRHGDYYDFQRYAPDLASFIGSKIFEANNFLSIWSQATSSHLSTELPSELKNILLRLPGEMPSTSELESWISCYNSK